MCFKDTRLCQTSALSSMSLRDKQRAKNKQRTEAGKRNPDRAVHAAPRNELERLRKELRRLEASSESSKRFLQNTEIRGAVIALYGGYGVGVLDDTVTLRTTFEAINKLRRKIATLENDTQT
ncbi:MAG: hypothetical protein ABSD96_08915 [Candidatus Korobacteraceae bacterium]